MDFETISRMVRASGVSEGELILVHFWGEDADKEIANRFVAAVAAAGASPEGYWEIRSRAGAGVAAKYLTAAI